MSNTPMENEEGLITLSLDDGKELECQIITIFEANDQDYIVLLPTDSSYQESEGEVFIYRYFETEDGDINLENIETDEEFEVVSDAFDEFLDSCEYEEYLPDDE